MSNSLRKIGFWSVVSIVLSSQIGSGILMLPASLAKFGGIGLASWIFTGVGAILLAIIFGELAQQYPKTGGPHVFVKEAFGYDLSFFIAWSYWVISWISTPAVIIAIIGYLGSLFGGFSSEAALLLELLLLVIFTSINLLGLRTSGYAEVLFTILKVIPLILLPIACIPFLTLENFIPFNVSDMPTAKALNAAAILTFWGFIGVECATTPAGSVENPNKTIPKAITLGTIGVALIYLISSGAVMSIVPLADLQVSKAPFAEAAKIIFGGNWYIIVSLAAAIICFGTLNAWILVSGQIALGAASDGLLPKLLGKQNRYGSPYIAILTSAIGMVPLIILSLNDNMIDQFTAIIDISVTVFLFIYLVCVLSYFKLMVFNKDRFKLSRLILGVLAFVFCIWALLASDLSMVALSFIIVLVAVPVYLVKRKIWQ